MATDVKDFASLSAPSDANEITRSNQLNSPLLRLPGEIRNRIYEYVFFGSEMIVRRWDGFSSYHPKIKSNTHIHLLATCQQVRHDATSIFWSACIFNVTDFHSIPEFESYMGQSNCARITSLVIDEGTALVLLDAGPDLAECDLESFPMLRKLYVQFDRYSFADDGKAYLLDSVSAMNIEVEYRYPEDDVRKARRATKQG